MSLPIQGYWIRNSKKPVYAFKWFQVGRDERGHVQFYSLYERSSRAMAGVFRTINNIKKDDDWLFECTVDKGSVVRYKASGVVNVAPPGFPFSGWLSPQLAWFTMGAFPNVGARYMTDPITRNNVAVFPVLAPVKMSGDLFIGRTSKDANRNVPLDEQYSQVWGTKLVICDVKGDRVWGLDNGVIRAQG